MRNLAVAVAALAVAVPLTALSQPVSAISGPDTYLDLHVGAFVPQHDDVEVLDPGFAFGGSIGARFTRNLGVEGELGFVRASGSSATSVSLTTDPGAPIGTMTAKQTLGMVPFAASLRLRLPLGAGELSTLAGASLAIAWVERRFTHDLATAGAGDARFSDTSAVFGFHVGAAAAFSLSPTMLVGAEARRTFTPAKFGGADLNLDGLRIALTLGYRL